MVRDRNRRRLRPALWYCAVGSLREANMVLLWLVLIPLIGGVLSLLVARTSARVSRWIAITALGLDLILTIALWTGAPTSRWWYEFDASWIPQFGIRFHLALDGLSLSLLALTFFLGLMSVLASWTDITER